MTERRARGFRALGRRLLLAGVLALSLPSTQAQDAPAAGSLRRIDTRPGVEVPIYAVWRADARATVVLFSGGGGGFGQIGADGWPGSGNFLIRSGKRWAAHPFNVVMVGRPSDGLDLAQGRVRISAEHAADNRAVLRAVHERSRAPIWLVGTSMGTISATAAALADREALVAGLVLTSSIIAYKVDGAVPTQKIESLRVPTLVVHHANDACWACRPHEARALGRQLAPPTPRRLVFIEGGGTPQGEPCGAFHHHGYIGQEDEVVDRIAAWILQPVSD